MAKSIYAKAVDDIQAALRPYLKGLGFRVRGRTFNRLTADGLTQVVNLQMGPSDPPGTPYIPGVRENLHGLFTVNLGVYVPEVARHHGGGEAKSWVQDYHCCIRDRLGHASGAGEDIWWHCRADEAVIGDVRRCLESGGIAFLERFATRDKILVELRAEPKGLWSSPPRIVMAIILSERGQRDEARELLIRQVSETEPWRSTHVAYVRSLAVELELESLEGSQST
jgi:hypothetical protein